MSNKTSLVQFLIDISNNQMIQVIKILTKVQLQEIIEIIYNVVQGVCSVSDSDKILLNKHKQFIRKILLKQTTLQHKKLLLLKIRKILPIFLKAYLQYVS
nr:TPA_asm: gasderminX [Mytilus Mediterranean mussel adintovirus]